MFRLLNRRCGPLTGATTAQIQSLAVEKLEDLANALLARLPGPGAPQPLAGRPQLKTLIPRGTNLALYERCSDI